MIVSRAKLNDGYTEWQINSTMPTTIQLFYVSKDGVSEQDPEIQELREEVEMLHEMLDKILLNG
jgi:hypothetical protein